MNFRKEHTMLGQTLLGHSVDRRRFLAASAGVLGASALSTSAWQAVADEQAASIARAPETIVKTLFQTLNENQRKAVCFDWEHVDSKLGLLRTRVENNWKITKPSIKSDFYTAEQQSLIRSIFEGIIHEDWHKKFDKQYRDDTGGFGNGQSIAIFGIPGSDKFEFVLTGRHTTLRCDGNTTEHVAFGGPIFYGHAAGTDSEEPNHPGNVFWEQAVAANSVYKMLDGKQRAMAEVASTPSEEDVGFRSGGIRPEGIAVSELSKDQQQELSKTLAKLIEPFRASDRTEVQKCVDKQGGLEKLHLAFYTDEDIGGDRVWDNWRLEGPSFVWHFRGSPHVHVWVNIADDSSVKLNT